MSQLAKNATEDGDDDEADRAPDALVAGLRVEAVGERSDRAKRVQSACGAVAIDELTSAGYDTVVGLGEFRV